MMTRATNVVERFTERVCAASDNAPRLSPLPLEKGVNNKMLRHDFPAPFCEPRFRGNVRAHQSRTAANL